MTGDAYAPGGRAGCPNSAARCWPPSTRTAGRRWSGSVRSSIRGTGRCSSPRRKFSLRPGKASLLCHSHDEQLSKLRSFVVTGELTGEGDSWTLHPSRFIPAADPKGPLSMVKTIRALRGTARRYLDRRGLSRPRIAWEDIETLKAEIAAAGHRAA